MKSMPPLINFALFGFALENSYFYENKSFTLSGNEFI